MKRASDWNWAGLRARVVNLGTALVIAAPASRPLLAEPASLPEPVIPRGFGVNIHFTGAPADLDRIAEAGFAVVRMDLGWGAVERERGVYNFACAGYDELTAACGQRGIRLLYILDYSNRLYEEDRSVRTDEGRQAYAAFAAAAARRYAGKKIIWEIWNEPNLEQFWTPQPSVDDYCALVAATAPRVREADPSGVIVAPACSGIPLDWLESCFARGLLDWVDALSLHPYRSKAPETVIEDYARLRALVDRHAPAGKQVPILSGEWGYSEINWDRSRLAPEEQAQYLTRMFLVNLEQKVPISIWYDWKDDGTDPDEREHHFGTVAHDLAPKPACRAMATLARLLAGYSVAERVDTGDERDFVVRLRRGAEEAAAAWTLGPGHPIVIPVQIDEPIARDIEGAPVTAAKRPRGVEVSVSSSPVYILPSSRTGNASTRATLRTEPRPLSNGSTRPVSASTGERAVSRPQRR